LKKVQLFSEKEKATTVRRARTRSRHD
jgi:hypothetical protein